MPTATTGAPHRARAGPPSPLALVITVGLVAPATIFGQRPLTENTLTATGEEAPSASLDDITWLTGHWIGEGLGSAAEESWLPPAGDAMVGVFRLVDDGGVQFYEIMTLREEAGSLVLSLKHFGPDLSGWEEREETVDFPLVARKERKLWFDGLTIHRTDDDELRVWVALSREGGPEAGEALFKYRRAAPGTSPY